MASANQARINELLLEREELFVRIHLAEKRAAELFGEPYPFERPTLPSDQKAKRKPASPRAKEPGAMKPVHLRSLGEAEGIYRVIYEQCGRVQEELHRDAAALTLLLTCQSQGLRVLRIEIVDTKGAVSALVYSFSDSGIGMSREHQLR